MVVDLGRCIGCAACVASCSVFHGTPSGILWNKMVYAEKGAFPNTTRLLMPKACQQGDNTPCVKVCPTGATY